MNMTNTETTTENATTIAAQGAHVAPKREASKKGATVKKRVQRAAKGGKAKATAPKKQAKAAKKPAKRPAKEARVPRAASKGAMILDLLRRAKGATLPQIMEVTGWQAHSVRGFISTAGKKPGIEIESVRGEDKERTYRINS